MAFVYEFDWIRSSSRVCVSERNPDASMCITVKKKTVFLGIFLEGLLKIYSFSG